METLENEVDGLSSVIESLKLSNRKYKTKTIDQAKWFQLCSASTNAAWLYPSPPKMLNLQQRSSMQLKTVANCSFFLLQCFEVEPQIRLGRFLPN